VELFGVILFFILREALIAPHNPDIYTRIYAPPARKPIWKRTAGKLRRAFLRKV
jgi:hypothetical protein